MNQIHMNDKQFLYQDFGYVVRTHRYNHILQNTFSCIDYDDRIRVDGSIIFSSFKLALDDIREQIKNPRYHYDLFTRPWEHQSESFSFEIVKAELPHCWMYDTEPHGSMENIGYLLKKNLNIFAEPILLGKPNNLWFIQPGSASEQYKKELMECMNIDVENIASL